MKYCEEFAALLDPYVDGELSEEEAVRVREHLESCPGCRRYVDEALAIRAAFPDVEGTPVPEGFAGGVMAAVREMEEKKTASRRRIYWQKALLPLAACFALVVALRAIPGAGKDAPVAAMDTAVSYGAAESGVEAYDAAEEPAAAPYSLAAAPQAADSEGSPEEAAAAPPQEPAGGAAPKEEGGAGSSRILTAPTTALQDGSAAGNGTAEAPAPQPAEAGGRTIRLTAAQAGELLAGLPYTVEAGGTRCYQLPGGDFDVLLETLAEQGISPVQEAAEDFPEGYDLVYVTEE